MPFHFLYVWTSHWMCCFSHVQQVHVPWGSWLLPSRWDYLAQAWGTQWTDPVIALSRFISMWTSLYGMLRQRLHTLDQVLTKWQGSSIFIVYIFKHHIHLAKEEGIWTSRRSPGYYQSFSDPMNWTLPRACSLSSCLVFQRDLLVCSKSHLE